MAGEPLPALDLLGELVHGRLDAAPRELDGEQLRAREVEHALPGAVLSRVERPWQLDVAARVERDHDADRRLPRTAMPSRIARRPSATLVR